jgi:hypothetical protein
VGVLWAAAAVNSVATAATERQHRHYPGHDLAGRFGGVIVDDGGSSLLFTGRGDRRFLCPHPLLVSLFLFFLCASHLARRPSAPRCIAQPWKGTATELD